MTAYNYIIFEQAMSVTQDDS